MASTQVTLGNEAGGVHSEVNSLFYKSTKEDLLKFIDICKSADVDTDGFFSLATYAIRYYSGDKSKREHLRVFQTLEAAWYKSLEQGVPDYSLYDDRNLIPDMWACWVVYSRHYIKLLATIKESLGSIKTIVDVGCGIGYTSKYLAQVFDKAIVYATNLKSSPQYRICEKVSNGSFHLRGDTQGLWKTDLVFASEYFEHFERPVEHLTQIINDCRPKYLVVANSFSAISMGHFNLYKDISSVIENKKMGRYFNTLVKRLGYDRMKTNFWNDRPVIFVRNEK